jgi:hypothetical protein
MKTFATLKGLYVWVNCFHPAQNVSALRNIPITAAAFTSSANTIQALINHVKALSIGRSLRVRTYAGNPMPQGMECK